jgi:hypothetical protein
MVKHENRGKSESSGSHMARPMVKFAIKQGMSLSGETERQKLTLKALPMREME